MLVIVMPVLNEGAGLLSRLKAFAPLRARGVRVILVDGGSAGGLPAAVAEHVDMALTAPRGRSSQMNAGAREAQRMGADVLLFLHADTSLPLNADEQVLAAMKGGARWGRFDVQIEGRHRLLGLVAWFMNRRSRLSGIATGDQAMFVERKLFASVGGFPEQPLMEDIALSKRLRAFAPPTCLKLTVSTSGRRWDANGFWGTVLLMWRLRAAYAMGGDSQTLARRYGYQPRAAAGLSIMAKAPVPGLAKTRLTPLLGAAGAARAQRAFVLRALGTAADAALGPVTLWCAPDQGHRLFALLRQRFGIDTRAQPDGLLGERMMAAMHAHFQAQPHMPWIVIGTDCPVLTSGQLQAMADALQTQDAALIPAEDGGYVALGLARPLASVFEDVAWSTSQVLAQTRERLRQSRARWTELPVLWDVDEPEDWQRWQREAMVRVETQRR